MSCDMFEFYTRSAVSRDDVFGFLSNFFHLSDGVIDENLYWENEAGEKRPLLGVKIYEFPKGLKSRTCVVANFSITDDDLAGLARGLARISGAEVVIGDYRVHGVEGQGLFLVYFPDGSVGEAVDDSLGDAPDVKVLRMLS